MAAIPLTFHCDETSHRGHSFAAVGGIACRPERLQTINHEIILLKEAAGYSSEIKWEKASNKYFTLYRNLVDYFFSLLDANHVHFHVLICDFNEYDHKRHNEGVRERSVSKSYYQLFLHRLCRLYGHKCNLILRTDGGDCTKELPRYMGALNHQSSKLFDCSPVKSITPIRDSKHVPIIGLNDIIIGAVAAHRNGRHLKEGASGHKIALSDAILTGFGLQHYESDTAYEGRRWTVWNWEPQPEKADQP